MYYVEARELYADTNWHEEILKLTDEEVMTIYEDSFGEGFEKNERIFKLNLMDELNRRYKFIMNLKVRIYENDEDIGTTRDRSPDYGDKRH